MEGPFSSFKSEIQKNLGHKTSGGGGGGWWTYDSEIFMPFFIYSSLF